jgi:hypothetical protein
MDRLSEMWLKERLPLGNPFVAGPGETGPAMVEMPMGVFESVAELVDDHLQARERLPESARRLFEACDQGNTALRETLGPMVEQWLEVTNWFMARAHDSGRVDGDTPEDLLRVHFELFEDTLWGLAGAFFSTLDDLDEILESANE